MNNVSSQDGQTALHRASKSGHTDVVKLLVDYGAQIDNKTKVLNHMIVLCLSQSPPSLSRTLAPSCFCPPLPCASCLSILI